MRCAPSRRLLSPRFVQAFLRQFAETYRFRLGSPKAIHVIPDGSSVLFLRSPGRNFVQNLFEVDVKTGKERVLLTTDKILNGAEARLQRRRSCFGPVGSPSWCGLRVQEKLSDEERALRERMRQTGRGIVSYQVGLCLGCFMELTDLFRAAVERRGLDPGAAVRPPLCHRPPLRQGSACSHSHLNPRSLLLVAHVPSFLI